MTRTVVKRAELLLLQEIRINAEASQITAKDLEAGLVEMERARSSCEALEALAHSPALCQVHRSRSGHLLHSEITTRFFVNPE